LSNTTALCQNPFYDAIDYTRITCNFKGSVSNGKEILVYGDGGIILRSADGGQNWERINLNDSLTIIGMVAIGSNFMGLCSERYAVVSADRGKNWQMQYLSDNQFYQLLAKDNKLYALLNGKVWVMNQQFQKIKEYSLPTDLVYNSITLLRNTIVCSVADGTLIMIDTDTDQQKTIALSSIVTAADYKITMPLKSNGSNLVYVALGSNLYQFNTTTTTATKLLFMQTKGTFENYNDVVYFLYRLNSSASITLDSLYFVKIDKSSNAPIQIKKPGNDRYIIGLDFQNLTFISKDTLIAVGKNNLIYTQTELLCNFVIQIT
jgi:hypothetical protein